MIIYCKFSHTQTRQITTLGYAVDRVLVGLFGGPDGNFLYFDDCDLDTFLAVKKTRNITSRNCNTCHCCL